MRGGFPTALFSTKPGGEGGEGIGGGGVGVADGGDALLDAETEGKEGEDEGGQVDALQGARPERTEAGITVQRGLLWG